MTHSGHKTWASALVNQKETKGGGINKSMQVHSNARYSDICHLHYWPAGQDCDLEWHYWPCERLCLQKCAEPTNSTKGQRYKAMAYKKDVLISFTGYRSRYFIFFMECQQNLMKSIQQTMCQSIFQHIQSPLYTVCCSPMCICSHWRGKSIKTGHKHLVPSFIKLSNFLKHLGTLVLSTHYSNCKYYLLETISSCGLLHKLAVNIHTKRTVYVVWLRENYSALVYCEEATHPAATVWLTDVFLIGFGEQWRDSNTQYQTTVVIHCRFWSFHVISWEQKYRNIPRL